MENNFEIQQLLFEEIRKNISSQHLQVDLIADVLEITRDSAYRRIRGEKPLTIKEVCTLCKHFRISFDELMGNRIFHKFDCVYQPVNVSMPEEYHRYMHTLLDRIRLLKNDSDSSIYTSALDIPIFHLIARKELMIFKLYTWIQCIHKYKGTMNDFMKEIDTSQLADAHIRLGNIYEQIPSAEIWTGNTIMSTLTLIDYNVETGNFSDKGLPLQLCEQVMSILNKLQEWTEKGEKGEYATPFKFYLSEMDLGNTYILIKRATGVSNCIVKLFTINNLNVLDKTFCNEVESWLNKLFERASMLSGNMEKERLKFFNAQRYKVRSLMEKIQADSYR